MTSPVAPALLRWWDQHGRKDLPWQQQRTPYRVWVSEIMLQQTQVAVVVPYFQRFMEQFPEVQDLAAAAADDVLHLWTGLGYYARARNLHKAAQQLVQAHNSEFPRDREQLEQLPGIGRSTAAAILALAHNQAETILDGNVKRVLARFHTQSGWPGQTAVQREFWALAESHTPKHRVADYTQAIMDLGATLCTRRNPDCTACPLADGCAARAAGTPHNWPEPKPRKTKPVRSTRMLLLVSPGGEVLLQQRPASGIWGGLYSLPETDLGTDPQAAAAAVLAAGQVTGTRHWPGLRHSFSHYHLDIAPVQLDLAARPDQVMADDRLLWYNPRQPARVGLAAPVQRLLQQLLQPPELHGQDIIQDQEPTTP